MPPKNSKGRWESRIERAQKLSADFPFAAEILRFYIRILNFQKEQYARIESACGTMRIARLGGSVRNELDLFLLLPSCPAVRVRLTRVAPAPLAGRASPPPPEDASPRSLPNPMVLARRRLTLYWAGPRP